LLIAHPDDPAMREYLIESESCDERFADAVLVNSSGHQNGFRWPERILPDNAAIRAVALS
jgi:hypothetical protein